MFCNKCGNKLKENARFCSVCGSKIEYMGLPITPVETTKKKRITGKEIRVVSIVLGIVAGALLLQVIIINGASDFFNERHRARTSSSAVASSQSKSSVIVHSDNANKSKVQEDDKNYRLAYDYRENGTASVMGGAYKEGTGGMEVEVPSTVERGGKSYTVTAIEEGAFTDCETLVSITLPDSITAIGNSAFSNCISLSSVRLPDGLTIIGDNAFENCRSMSSMVLPEGLTGIGEDAFSGCQSLIITVPEGLTNVDSAAFAGCKKVVYESDQGKQDTGNASDFPEYKRSDFVSDEAYENYKIWGNTSGLKNK